MTNSQSPSKLEISQIFDRRIADFIQGWEYYENEKASGAYGLMEPTDQLLSVMGEIFSHFQNVHTAYLRTRIFQIFWSYVSKGFLCPGSLTSVSHSSDRLPYFHVTRSGREYFLDQNLVGKYFDDENSYLERLGNHGVNLDPVSESYVKEAVNCYFSGCPRASMVMIGVALEKLFLDLLNAIDSSTEWKPRLFPNGERNFSGKLRKFARKAENERQAINGIVSTENHQIYLTTMIDHLRQYRNDGAHPELPQRDSDDAFATLESFIRTAQILTELTAHIH